ncbi:MAG: transglycosylase SLT domain-containing protein [Methyloprofundus sp.]|nr:transglycosylase SLT domain-containing protein [Methyloprofundus sp.]
MRYTTSFLLLFTLLFTRPVAANLFDIIGDEKGVNPAVLWLIALQESAPPGSYAPHPWTANWAGKGYYYPTRLEAYRAISEAVDEGYKVDVGLMQVNWFYHEHRFNHDLWAALDPEVNIRVAADILLGFSRHGVYEAIGRYHCPNWQLDWCRKRAERYSQNVIARLQHYEN